MSLPSKKCVCEVWTCVCACKDALEVEVSSLCKIRNFLNKLVHICSLFSQTFLFINMLNSHAGIGPYWWVVNGLLYELAFTIDSRKIKKISGKHFSEQFTQRDQRYSLLHLWGLVEHVEALDVMSSWYDLNNHTEFFAYILLFTLVYPSQNYCTSDTGVWFWYSVKQV